MVGNQIATSIGHIPATPALVDPAVGIPLLPNSLPLPRQNDLTLDGVIEAEDVQDPGEFTEDNPSFKTRRLNPTY